MGRDSVKRRQVGGRSPQEVLAGLLRIRSGAVAVGPDDGVQFGVVRINPAQAQVQQLDRT